MSLALRNAVTKWLNIYYDLLEWGPISQPSISAPLASPTIGIFSVLKNGRHIGVAISGRTPCCFLWSDCLRQKVFCSSTIQLAFPKVFLLMVGLLCAIWISSRYIRNSHFTCYIDSPTLTIILRKGRDKRCKRTTTVLEAIFLSLINLDAFPSFELRVGISPPEAPRREIPEAIWKWLGTLRPTATLAHETIKALALDGRISPL